MKTSTAPWKEWGRPVSQKPPPMFSRWESLRIGATPRMLRGMVVVALAVLIPSGAGTLFRPDPPRVGPIPLPVPAQEWTTEARGWSLPVLLGTIPPPGPNQKRAGKCNPKAAQVEIRGGCWVQTTTPRPCPEGVQWEHDDGRCYLPVAEAKPVPQSGEPQVVNIAGEP